MIDTNKAREIAQRLKEGEQPIINLSKLLGVKLPDGTLLPEAAALLLALADAHDRMAKALERIRNEPYPHAVDARLIAHRAIDAAMGADNG